MFTPDNSTLAQRGKCGNYDSFRYVRYILRTNTRCLQITNEGNKLNELIDNVFPICECVPLLFTTSK